MLEQEPRLLSVTEFAAAIGRSERTVNRYAKKGRLKTVHTGGQLRIPETELQRFSELLDADMPPFATDTFRAADAAMPTSPEPAPTPRADVPTRPADTWEVHADTPTSRADMSAPSADAPIIEVQPTQTQPPVGEEAPPQRSPVGLVPLERYEVVVTRLGYLEGQLELTQRMLTDGGQIAFDMRLRAEQAEQKAQEAQRELEAARQRIAEMEQQQQRSWWKKLFST